MSGVVIDTSICISFFRGRPEDKADSDALNYLISGDEVVVDDVFLSKLVPFLNVRGKFERSASLFTLQSPPIGTDWDDLRKLQRHAFVPVSTRSVFRISWSRSRPCASTRPFSRSTGIFP